MYPWPCNQDYLGFFFFSLEVTVCILSWKKWEQLNTRCRNIEDVCSGRLIIFPIPSTVQSFWFTISTFAGARLLSLKTSVLGTWSTISIQPWQMDKGLSRTRQEEPTSRRGKSPPKAIFKWFANWYSEGKLFIYFSLFSCIWVSRKLGALALN